VLRYLSALCLLTIAGAHPSRVPPAPLALLRFSSDTVDPFVGKWKLNPSKSRLPDEMTVEVAGTDRYILTFGPGAVDTIVADGRDHPALQGTTLSIAVVGPNGWKVIRKQQGHMLISADWTLSGDGKTLNDAFTGYGSDGSATIVHYVYERTAGTSGFPGTWDSVKEEVGSVIELTIQPYEGDGLSFESRSALMVMAKKIRFDGSDYPHLDPGASPALVSSGRRANDRRLEMTEKFQGKVTGTEQVDLSPDLKTLTLTVRQVGQSKPPVLVFDRD
jgi:hypothetical protein